MRAHILERLADRVVRKANMGGGSGGNLQGIAAGQASGLQAYQQAWAANQQIRRLWTHGSPATATPAALNMWQRLNPGLPGTVATGTQLTCQLRNVGLIKRLVIEISGTITTAGGAGDNVALTPWGLSNVFSNIQFYDLANNLRINTSGWHLTALSTVKRRKVWGSAATTDTPFGYGSNFTVNSAPSTIAGSGTVRTFRAFFEIPFTRNDHDLRGAIWGSVSTAVMTLYATINPTFFVGSAGDPTLAVYANASSSNLPTLSGVTWNVWQNYLDQGPRDGNGNPILPPQDIATAYLLNNTTSVQPTQGADNATPFVNQRQFLSTVIGYDNAGTLNVGSDITYIQLQSANLTKILDFDPFIASLLARVIIGDDMPKGMYYLDFNDRPVDTTQFGNMQIVINPSSVAGATANFLFGYESLGVIGQVNQGGALPSGA